MADVEAVIVKKINRIITDSLCTRKVFIFVQELNAHLIKTSFFSCEITYRGEKWQCTVFCLYSQFEAFFLFNYNNDEGPTLPEET